MGEDGGGGEEEDEKPAAGAALKLCTKAGEGAAMDVSAEIAQRGEKRAQARNIVTESGGFPCDSRVIGDWQRQSVVRRTRPRSSANSSLLSSIGGFADLAPAGGGAGDFACE